MSSLIDMKTIMQNKKEKPENPMDANYQRLNCQIIQIEKSNKMYKMIEKYAKNTQDYDNFEIIDIF